VVSAVVGSIGLLPLLAAIEEGKDVALANKESIVMAGEIIVQKAQEKGVAILPIDSEHSAIFQALGGKTRGEGVKRIILTASGGPFYTLPVEALQAVSPQEALAHPVWEMGPKISVDSATMMNKGLEVIEAHWFFQVPPERIEIVIHPQGIIHSLVEYLDSSIIAQLSVPDMRIPIAYALSYPQRLATGLPGLNLAELNHLTFDPPDFEKFPSLKLAYEALERGGTLPAVLNAANEVAVEAFLQGKIGFDHIPQVVASTMNGHNTTPLRGVEDVLKADQWAKGKALDFIREVDQ
jgi:1-deoxy-D-xylulose-5-phosphate reductoisomerase